MIIKISHLPNWANVINHDDETGYWAETESGHPVFLSPKNRIILPKKFRGQKIDALSPEDFDNLPDDDKPDAHYKSWQDKIQKDKANSKLHDGFDFTEKGNALVNRLLSFAKKYNLDDVSKMGLPESESLNFDIFNKLLSGTNHVKEVKRLGAKLAKEIKQIINSVNKINPRLAKKMNNDFVFQYKKLQQLFDFDIDAHDEKIKAKLQEKISPIRTDLSELLRFFEGDSNFITPSTYITCIIQNLEKGNTFKAEKYYHLLIEFLHEIIKLEPLSIPAQSAIKALKNPVFETLNTLLFE